MVDNKKGRAVPCSTCLLIKSSIDLLFKELLHPISCKANQSRTEKEHSCGLILLGVTRWFSKIHDEHYYSPHHAEGTSSGLTGRSIVNEAPPPGLFATWMLPPCCSTRRFVMARPSPVPFAFVVKKGRKILLIMLLSIPLPVSVIVIRRNRDASSSNVCVVSVPPPGIASAAFKSKFMNTCWS